MTLSQFSDLETFMIIKKMGEAKNWCFTSYADEVPFFDSTEVNYCIFGNEKCPETGRWHKQGFVQFKKKKRLSALKKLDSTAHFEVMRGSVQQAIEYCKKDGDFYTVGDYVSPGLRVGDEYKVITDLVRKRKFDEIEDSKYYGTYIRYKKSFDSMIIYDTPTLIEPRGIWVVGKPGCGKDTTVMEFNPYVKAHNKWWDGYNNEPYILFSDLDAADSKWIGCYLKQWTDRYPFHAEIKGGSILISPRRFYVTSNYTLQQLFEFDEKLLEALRRRFSVVLYDNDIVVPRKQCIYESKKQLLDFD